MKKRIFSLLLCCVMLVGLLPVTAFADGENTQNEKIYGPCSSCHRQRTQEIIGYTANAGWGTSDEVHFVIVKCLTCGNEDTYLAGEPKYMYHTGGTETPTCTTGKTCEKCGAEYGKLGHDWGAWQSNGDNKTHTRTCKREGCNAVDTASCGGDGTATCVTPGTCADCGQQYYSGHTFPSEWNWTSDTNIGRDAEKHWICCLNCEEGRKKESAHHFVQGNVHLKSAATCISNVVCYTNCDLCYYKGTDTYVYQWGQLDPNNHDSTLEWTQTATTHQQEWSCCHVETVAEENHEWENGVCSECHYACAHTGGTATCKEQAACEICGEKYGSINPDNHNDPTEWIQTDTKHTQQYKCCGVVTVAEEDHEWENGVCTECRYACVHTGGTADCTEKAICAVCGENYGELDSNNHVGMEHIRAKAATRTAEGNIEYWYCEGCGKYFADEDGTEEITKEDTVTAKLPGKKPTSPATGDTGELSLWLALLFVNGGAVTAAVAYGRKKKRSVK